jgi:oligopeptide/dipeptide ABC transporter ATP-binding protein
MCAESSSKAPTRALFANMKMPYTEALLKSIPKLENASHTKLQIIGGRPPDLVNPPKGCRFAPRCPYVRERCQVEEPPLVEAETAGHVYACWYPVGSPSGTNRRSIGPPPQQQSLTWRIRTAPPP